MHYHCSSKKTTLASSMHYKESSYKLHVFFMHYQNTSCNQHVFYISLPIVLSFFMSHFMYYHYSSCILLVFTHVFYLALPLCLDHHLAKGLFFMSSVPRFFWNSCCIPPALPDYSNSCILHVLSVPWSWQNTPLHDEFGIPSNRLSSHHHNGLS